MTHGELIARWGWALGIVRGGLLTNELRAELKLLGCSPAQIENLSRAVREIEGELAKKRAMPAPRPEVFAT